jgi:hypothetical protein
MEQHKLIIHFRQNAENIFVTAQVAALSGLSRMTPD